MYIHAVCSSMCHFCFAIAKVLRIPKAKKHLRLIFANAAKGFFNRKTMISLLKPLHFTSFYSFTFLLLNALFTFLLFYFSTFICTFA